MAAGRFGGAGRVLAALAVAVAVAACTAGNTPAVPAATTGSTAAAATTGACPASPDAGAAAGASPTGAAQTGAAPLIRPGAVTAVICQYTTEPPSKKTAGMLTRIPLGAVAADGLAALFDDAAQVTNPPPCAGFAFAQIVIFGYRSGPAVTATVRFGDCSPPDGVVTAGGRTAVFSGQIGQDLNVYSMPSLLGSGPRVPDVTGLSPAAATAVAKRHGLTLQVDGTELDTSVPAGTVIFQFPPSVAAASSVPGSQLDVVTATSVAPACTPAQLTLSFRGGEPGAGNDFGMILFRDTSAAACTLAGKVSATGVNTAGDPVTATVTSTFAGPGYLSAGAAPVPDGDSPPPGEVVYWWMLTSEYRDGPANVDNGSCVPDWVVPASWRITLADGATFTVANSDPANLTRLVANGGLVTCLGRLGSATQPAYMQS